MISAKMKIVSMKGSIIEMKCEMEKSIRTKVSENVILAIHEKLYKPIKKGTTPIIESIITSLNENSDYISNVKVTEKLLEDLTNLVINNALVRTLQKKVLEIKNRLNIELITESEISVQLQNKSKGRIDLMTVNLKNKKPKEIIELKRARVKLIKLGNDIQLTEKLKKTISQINNYGLSIIISKKSKLNRHRFHNVLKIIVYGRKISSKDYVILISQNEINYDLLIYSWDGYAAELERLYT